MTVDKRTLWYGTAWGLFFKGNSKNACCTLEFPSTVSGTAFTILVRHSSFPFQGHCLTVDGLSH